mmetsp:Transcript_124030/g.310000  ORF Transcript_124030/g.310000 Transcript_124030/m.310000 type:complete len:207 (+) Transcript_124030:44-664(+)
MLRSPALRRLSADLGRHAALGRPRNPKIARHRILHQELVGPIAVVVHQQRQEVAWHISIAIGPEDKGLLCLFRRSKHGIAWQSQQQVDFFLFFLDLGVLHGRGHPCVHVLHTVPIAEQPISRQYPRIYSQRQGFEGLEEPGAVRVAPLLPLRVGCLQPMQAVLKVLGFETVVELILQLQGVGDCELRTIYCILPRCLWLRRCLRRQ